MNYQLTFIISTYNHLSFLKITLERLLDELQSDEEIVVVDGNSSDGSKEYLEGLFGRGKIHQFISEPDKNQAHGWNKALLMARGTIIKKIIDDDVFCYKGIRKCKDYILQNPAVDVVISNDLTSVLNDHTVVQKASRLPQFEKWKNNQAPSFTFGDVHMLIRRTSLAYVGLYNPSFVMMDWEYSLRISYLQANIAYYTGYNALSVSHSQTVSSQRNINLVNEQGKRGNVFYEYSGDRTGISIWSEIKIGIGRALNSKKSGPASTKKGYIIDIPSAYNFYYDYIDDLNNKSEYIFIEKA